jgi:hypothetical protein
MFLKEILSRGKHVLNEIVDKKVCNSKLYEKSYIRNLLIDSNCLHRVDNNKQFFIQKKKRKKRRHYPLLWLLMSGKKPTIRQRSRRDQQLARRKTPRNYLQYGRTVKYSRILNRDPKKFKMQGYKGYFSYTTVHIYKSRKSDFIRFELARFKVSRPNGFVDLFLKGIRTLITGRIKERENSLMLLCIKRGGFKCYSSGFKGFLTEIQFYKMLRIGLKRYKSNPFVFKSIIEYQKFRWFVSSPPRFRFVIQTFIPTFEFRRNKFVLSRKKDSHCHPRFRTRIQFHSTSASMKKTHAQLTRSELLKKFDYFKRRIQ